MRAGEIVASGTVGQIQAAQGTATRIRFALEGAAAPPAATVPETSRRPDGSYEIRSDAPVELLHGPTGWAIQAGVGVIGLSVAKPSLEDTYLELTGTAPDEA